MNLSELVNLRNQLAKVLDISIIQNEIEANYLRLQRLSDGIDQDISKKVIEVAEDHKNK